jgi:hypothetical protein
MRGPAHLLLLAGLAATLGSTGQALGEIAGVTSVIDGDTIEVHGQRIRLHGIVPPKAARSASMRPARNGVVVSALPSHCRISSADAASPATSAMSTGTGGLSANASQERSASTNGSSFRGSRSPTASYSRDYIAKDEARAAGHGARTFEPPWE